MNEKIRNSNFELLKVILTIMILVLHYCNGYIGGALSNIPVGTVNYHLIHIAESLCIASVNTFIVITGYFMCRKNGIRISKILKILYLTLVYGVLIFFGWFIISHPQINTETIKLSVASISNRWFVIIYCILFLLIPYINKVVQSINKRQFQILLMILLFFFYIWPTFFTNITVKDNGYGITNFLTLYQPVGISISIAAALNPFQRVHSFLFYVRWQPIFSVCFRKMLSITILFSILSAPSHCLKFFTD